MWMNTCVFKIHGVSSASTLSTMPSKSHHNKNTIWFLIQGPNQINSSTTQQRSKCWFKSDLKKSDKINHSLRRDHFGKLIKSANWRKNSSKIWLRRRNQHWNGTETGEQATITQQLMLNCYSPTVITAEAKDWKPKQDTPSSSFQPVTTWNRLQCQLQDTPSSSITVLKHNIRLQNSFNLWIWAPDWIEIALSGLFNSVSFNYCLRLKLQPHRRWIFKP